MEIICPTLVMAVSFGPRLLCAFLNYIVDSEIQFVGTFLGPQLQSQFFSSFYQLRFLQNVCGNLNSLIVGQINVQARLTNINRIGMNRELALLLVVFDRRRWFAFSHNDVPEKWVNYLSFVTNLIAVSTNAGSTHRGGLL